MDFGISAIISAAIAAASSAASTGASIGATGQLNKKNRKWQEKMYKLAVENNRADAETAYGRQQENAQMAFDLGQQQEQNHFQNLMQSARAAGVNPGMALGAGGGTGGASVPQATQAAPAQTGTPQTFSPQIMDLSQAAKNIADAKLAEATAKKEEGLTGMIEQQKELLASQTAKNWEEIKKINEETKLTNSQAEWQNIQNTIAKATQGTQIQITEKQLEALNKAIEKDIEEIRGMNIENDNKQKLIDATLKLQRAQLIETQFKAASLKIENQKELKSMESYLTQMENLAEKLQYEAKNEKEYRERFEKEMKQRNKELWVKVGSDTLQGFLKLFKLGK